MKQLRTRLTDENWENLQELADKQGQSLTTVLNELLTSAFESRAGSNEQAVYISME